MVIVEAMVTTLGNAWFGKKPVLYVGVVCCWFGSELEEPVAYGSVEAYGREGLGTA
jgi:hypothetical protein